jgi:hypothetical protein
LSGYYQDGGDDDDLRTLRIPPHLQMLALGIAILFGLATAVTACFTPGFHRLR